MINSKDEREIRIDNIKDRDLTNFRNIHIEYLSPGMNKDFSKIYFTERFEWLMKTEDIIMIGARDLADNLVGLVYGGPEGYKHKMNKYILSRVAFKTLTNFKLLIELNLFSKIFNSFKNKLKM